MGCTEPVPGKYLPKETLKHVRKSRRPNAVNANVNDATVSVNMMHKRRLLASFQTTTVE